MHMRISKNTVSIALAAILALTLASPVYAGSVNKSIRIGAGNTSGGESSVNGSITVGNSAVVTGNLSTVNGRVHIDSDAQVEDVSTVNGSLTIDSGVTADSLSTVNGSIDVDSESTINGEIEAVNGSIDLDKGSRVARDVSNVNGEIRLRAAKVGGDISTVSGDVRLEDASEVMGDIVVEEPHGWGWNDKKRRIPEIVIGPGSRVHGEIRLEREVKLYISDTAEVGGVRGKLSMDDAIRFSGERP